MKKVKATRIPTIKQMSAMAFNLQEKFRRFSAIDISCDAHYESKADVSYHLYVADKESKKFDNWITMQGCYFSLMED